MRLPTLLAVLLCVASPSWSAEPVAPREAMPVGRARVTLLSVAPLPVAQRRGSAGGRVVQWLVEPPEGEALPVFGEVRLWVGGTLYNAITNATSSRPGAPDLIIDDARKLGFGASDPMSAMVFSPRPGSVVVTVLLRGAALADDVKLVTSLEVGTWPPGTKTPQKGLRPKYVEVHARWP